MELVKFENVEVGNRVEVLENKNEILVGEVVSVTESGKTAKVKLLEKRAINIAYKANEVPNLETKPIRKYDENCVIEMKLLKTGYWRVSSREYCNYHADVIVNRVYGKDYYLLSNLGPEYVAL